MGYVLAVVVLMPGAIWGLGRIQRRHQKARLLKRLDEVEWARLIDSLRADLPETTGIEPAR